MTATHSIIWTDPRPVCAPRHQKSLMETTGLISSLSAAIWAPSAQFQPGKTWFPFVVVLFILEKKKEKAGTNKTTFPHIDTGVLFYNQIPLTVIVKH